MKKLLLIIPMLMLSCNKEKTLTEKTINADSVIVPDGMVVENDSDSLGKDNVILDKKANATSRTIYGDSIVQTINGDRIPLTISDEFATNDQQMVLKIKNFDGKEISGKIIPENPEMNIRFNQIKLSNGDYDGPFGRDIEYDVKEKGEIWLIITKSNMASGDATGKFTVRLK